MNTAEIYEVIHQTQQQEDVERVGLSPQRFGITDSITAKLSSKGIGEIR